MKQFLIRHTEGGYLYKGANAKWERTPNFGLAEKMDYFKACVLNEEER